VWAAQDHLSLPTRVGIHPLARYHERRVSDSASCPGSRGSASPRASQRSAAALFTARVLLAWLLVPFVVSSATAERLPIRNYTTDDGLAHANVRRIVRDPHGFLWFCTIDGLSRFDGAEFVTYRTGDGLPDPWVTDLLTTRDGTYWIPTNGGIARFDPLARRAARDGRRVSEERPRQFFRDVAFEGPPTQRLVRVLLEDRAGRVWGGGVGCPCRTEVMLPSGSGPSSRVCGDGHVACGACRRQPVDWDPQRPIPSPDIRAAASHDYLSR
jgi:hypothetical protein